MTGPKHIAFIMDGNRRWAHKKGVSLIEGHRKGAHRAFEITQAAFERGAQYVTLYAFSVENWKRSSKEVQGLLGLLEHFLSQEGKKLLQSDITIKILGKEQAFPLAIRSSLKLLTKRCKPHEETQKTLLLALNYAARTELIDAVQAYAQAVQKGEADTKTLSWEGFSSYLYTASIPDPDLIIRTSGEQRLSNFLLLQSAYAELYFSSALWPDFTPEALDTALSAFASRERLFGAGSR